MKGLVEIVRNELIMAAKRRKTTTEEYLMLLVEQYSQNTKENNLNELIREIGNFDLENNRPELWCLLLKEETGQPDNSYFMFLEQRNQVDMTESREDILFKQQSLAHDYWSKRRRTGNRSIK